MKRRRSFFKSFVGVAQFSTTVVEREGAKEFMRINRAKDNISMHLQDKNSFYLFFYFVIFFNGMEIT